MYAKIHSNGMKSVLAVCDKELLGKTLKHREIHFTVSKSFYGGELIERKKLLELLEEHENINLVGEKCTNTALEKGLINKKSIIMINSVPHAQIFKLNV